MAEEKELKEVCIVEGCPNAGRHFKEEHDDYAVLAAKEWLAGKQEQLLCRRPDCVICRSIVTSNAAEIAKLAAVIRKHVDPVIEQALGTERDWWREYLGWE